MAAMRVCAAVVLLWAAVAVKATLREEAERLRKSVLLSMAEETLLPPRPRLSVHLAFQLTRILRLVRLLLPFTSSPLIC